MQSKSLDISVVINTSNQGPTVNFALRALADQDFTGLWEIIVVDDGSTDATSQFVTSWSKRMRIPVTYICLEDRGMRWCHARNVGIQLSAGKVLLFLDGDIVPDREVVRLHSTQQVQMPCLLAGDRLWRNASVDFDVADNVDEQIWRLRTSTESTDAGYWRREMAESRLRQELLVSSFPWRACFGCHISIPAIAGITYDESMVGWGPADLEFACRLYHNYGLPVRFLSDARAWHVERSGACYNPFRTGDIDGATEYVRQVCYMLDKHSNLNLIEVIDQGFDRLILDSNDQWRIVSRGAGSDKRQILEKALQWYMRRRDQK